MGKNNSVKKIDEEQILKRFEYTVQEYIRFYDFYKNQEVSEENTEAFYVMLQTKLMILRKYDYNREDVYLSNVFDAIDKMYPEVGENINILREKFEKLNNYYMESVKRLRNRKTFGRCAFVGVRGYQSLGGKGRGYSYRRRAEFLQAYRVSRPYT